MEFLITLKSVSSLFMLVLTGYAIKKLNVVNEGFTRPLSNFLFYVSLPAMIISSMEFPFTPDRLVESLKLVAAGACIIIISMLISGALVRFFDVDFPSRNVYEFSMIFSNFGFMGLPVAGTLFGKEGIFLASIFSIPIYLIVNSYGIMLMQRGPGGWRGVKAGNIINPPLVAVLTGFGLFTLSLKLPDIISIPLNMLGSTTTPLSMVLAGMLLAGVKAKDMFGNFKVYIVSFVRLLALPVLVMLVYGFFETSPVLIGVSVIITAMPAAANVSILSEKFGGNSLLGAQCVFISTLFSIVTIPLMAWML